MPKANAAAVAEQVDCTVAVTAKVVVVVAACATPAAIAAAARVAVRILRMKAPKICRSLTSRGIPEAALFLLDIPISL